MHVYNYFCNCLKEWLLLFIEMISQYVVNISHVEALGTSVLNTLWTFRVFPVRHNALFSVYCSKCSVSLCLITERLTYLSLFLKRT